MERLNADYLKKQGTVPLAAGEEIKEIVGNGEYFDYKDHEARPCCIVFTNKRLIIYAMVTEKKRPFLKAKSSIKIVGQTDYSSISTLNRMKVGSDDSFCRAQLIDGTDIAFNLIGEVFGPLAKKIETFAGREISRNSTISRG